MRKFSWTVWAGKCSDGGRQGVGDLTQTEGQATSPQGETQRTEIVKGESAGDHWKLGSRQGTALCRHFSASDLNEAPELCKINKR